MRRLVGAVLMVCMFYGDQAYAQWKREMLRDTAEIADAQFRSLTEEYGKNKKLPPGYEKIALFALSFFPELKNNKIQFILRSTGAPLSTRPRWGGVFRSAGKRTYLVFINSGGDDRFGSVFRNASIPAQIGIIGHELSHIVNFARKSGFGLMGMGVSHISKSYMDRFEFYTDSLAIAHGLGSYQKEWAAIFDQMFAKTGMENPFKSSSTPTGERYMSAATIELYMKKMGYR
ncbi:MAG TPA: hypothetical protein VLA58_10550 [Chitinophagaceae bacterium]|nr:hypothetical protein [Chitinophagaceae bacterium]